MRILLVDSLPLEQSPVQAMLTDEPEVEVIRVHSSALGREILQLDDPFGTAPAFDVAVLDHAPPEADALDLCRAIKRLDRFKELPVILLTDRTHESDIEAAFSAGATDNIHKPIYRVEFLARVRSALALKRAADERKAGEARTRRDIALAKQVQRGALSLPIRDARIEIDAAYIPSQDLSGDMYGWCRIDGARFGVWLFDVMGHGISSALVSMALRSTFQDLISGGVDAGTAMVELNRRVREFQPYFVTAIYLLIDTDRQIITYANAGHPPGLMLTPAQQVISLARTGMPLGVKETYPGASQQIPYRHPMRLILYTDGLTDDPGRRSPRQGLDQLTASLLSHGRLDTSSFIARTIMERGKILTAADDVCLICISAPEPVNSSADGADLQGVGGSR